MTDTFWVTVLRSFDAGGVTLQINDIVDAAEWRTREALIRQRWIRAATTQEVDAAEEEVTLTAPPPPPKARVRSTKKR